MVSWAYIAGFLDGDGWIGKTNSVSKRCKKNIVYTIGMTQVLSKEKEMKEIYDFVESSNIRIKWNTRKQHVSSRGDGYMINLTIKHQESVIKFLNNIKKHLIIKKMLAIECINYLKQKVILRKEDEEMRKELIPRQSTNLYWTQEEVISLKEMLLQERSNIYIASKFGRSVNSVGHKIYRLGLKR